jgi:hypothetical protein
MQQKRNPSTKKTSFADIIMRCVLSSGLALGLAAVSLLSTTAHASDWLYSYQSPGIDSFDRQAVTPLMTLEVSAGTSAFNNDSLDISASFKGITYQTGNHNLAYSEYTKEFQLSAPLRTLDFSAEIRERCQLSPQKMLDKLIINGGVGFNLNW